MDPIHLIPEPSPPEPSRSALTELSHECMVRILECLWDVSPESLFDVALTCSCLYQQVRYIQSSSVSVVLGPDDCNSAAAQHKDNSIKRLEYLVQNDLLAAVRTLHVTAPGLEPPINCWDGSPWKQLSEAFPQMTGLCEMHWNAHTVPIKVLDELSKRPRLRFHLSIQGRIGDPGRSSSDIQGMLEWFKNSSHLVSVNARLLYSNTLMLGNEIMKPLKTLLISCPNLRHLSLDIGQDKRHWTGPWPDERYHGLGFTNGESFLSLKSLTIYQYPWGIARALLHPFQESYHHDGYPSKIHETEYWTTQCDWSQLAHLDFDVGTFLRHDNLSSMFTSLLAPRLRSLTSVRCKGDIPCIRRFFSTLPEAVKFESVCLENIPVELVKALARHRDTLTELTLTGTLCGILEQDVANLAFHFPYLRSLNIRLRRTADGSLPWSIIDDLATYFTNLRELTIHFPSFESQFLSDGMDYLTRRRAGRIFNSLFSNWNIEKVNLFCGDFAGFDAISLDMHGHSTRRWWEWEQANRTAFAAERVVDGKSPQVRYRVRCTTLSRRWDEILETVSRDEERVERLIAQRATIKKHEEHGRSGENEEELVEDVVPEAFWVALDGPSPYHPPRGMSWPSRR
ncbi:hypothetical protein QBC44DRAFT_144288 [Cladorrhinum sp. PSN332]|nr:hypothetical protein QBC44DRAFT_144288 [Cladorrhinum sp. PSN332]